MSATYQTLQDEHDDRTFKFSIRSVAFAVFLFSLTLSVQAGKISGSPYIAGAFVAAGILVLFLCVKSASFLQHSWTTAAISVPILGLALVMLSSINSGELSSVVKAFLLIALFFVVASRVPSLSSREILTGMLLFAIAEILFVVVTRTEWNANAFCNHVVFATLCGAGASMAFQRRLFRWCILGWLVLGLGVTFWLGSRTAVIGLLSCVCFYLAVRKGKLGRITLAYIFLIGVGLSIVWSGDITGGIVRVAKRNLGSTNVISRFLLEDKTSRKLETDFFDRRRLWDAAYKTMVRNPWLGIGYDQSLSRIKEFRAHNAYLEIGYQCGVIAMVVWGLIYLSFVDFSLTRIANHPDDPLLFIAFTSSLYLILAGLMESSGIMSIATPGNWVAVSTYVFLKSRESVRGSPETDPQILSAT